MLQAGLQVEAVAQLFRGGGRGRRGETVRARRQRSGHDLDLHVFGLWHRALDCTQARLALRIHDCSRAQASQHATVDQLLDTSCWSGSLPVRMAAASSSVRPTSANRRSQSVGSPPAAAAAATYPTTVLACMTHILFGTLCHYKQQQKRPEHIGEGACLNGLVAVRGDVGGGLATLEAGVRLKVLVLHHYPVSDNILLAENHAARKIRPSCKLRRQRKTHTVGSPPSSLVSTSLAPLWSWRKQQLMRHMRPSAWLRRLHSKAKRGGTGEELLAIRRLRLALHSMPAVRVLLSQKCTTAPTNACDAAAVLSSICDLSHEQASRSAEVTFCQSHLAILLAEEAGRALAGGQVLQLVRALASQLPQQRIARHMRRRRAAACCCCQLLRVGEDSALIHVTLLFLHMSTQDSAGTRLGCLHEAATSAEPMQP